jgi:hypothetical protein
LSRLGDKGLLIAAALASAAAGIVLALVPLYSSGRTLIEVNGAGVLWAILVPIALASLPLAAPARRRRTVAFAVAGLLVLISFVSSAGIFFLPAAVLLMLAGRAAGRTRTEL